MNTVPVDFEEDYAHLSQALERLRAASVALEAERRRVAASPRWGELQRELEAAEAEVLRVWEGMR